MKQSGLDRLFKPHSIAVIGASSDPQKAGHVVIRHLLAGQFQGPILPVAPPQPGHRWRARLSGHREPSLPDPPSSVPGANGYCRSSRSSARKEPEPPSYWPPSSPLTSACGSSICASNTASGCSAPTAWACCSRQGINASFSPLQRLRDRWRFSPSLQRSAPPSWIGPSSAKSASRPSSP